MKKFPINSKKKKTNLKNERISSLTISIFAYVITRLTEALWNEFYE